MGVKAAFLWDTLPEKELLVKNANKGGSNYTQSTLQETLLGKIETQCLVGDSATKKDNNRILHAESLVGDSARKKEDDRPWTIDDCYDERRKL
jgi:hypothetical protein